ncbi:MAG: hypothetical protein U0Q15_03345 [Kineosporiaceae bacterium]
MDQTREPGPVPGPAGPRDGWDEVTTMVDGVVDARSRTAQERDRLAEARERAADERDLLADARDRLADLRDEIADERDQRADERDLAARARHAVGLHPGPDRAERSEQVDHVLRRADARDRTADARDADARARDLLADERDRVAGTVSVADAARERGQAEVDRDWAARDRDLGAGDRAALIEALARAEALAAEIRAARVAHDSAPGPAHGPDLVSDQRPDQGSRSTEDEG